MARLRGSVKSATVGADSEEAALLVDLSREGELPSHLLASLPTTWRA
jgi:hypothetical protein